MGNAVNQQTLTKERDKMDCAFLRAHAHYLDTAETKWPYVNSARAIGETGRRVADRMEAKDAEIERLRSLFSPELLGAAYQALAFVARHDPTYPQESERRAADFRAAVLAYEQVKQQRA